MSAKNEVAKMELLVNELAHEINIAHNIDCNRRARFHIRNLLTKNRNENEKKWNELNFWLRNNPSATVDEVQVVRTLLNSGETVRGFRVKQLTQKA
jgi:anti-sigma-K factor RskA